MMNAPTVVLATGLQIAFVALAFGRPELQVMIRSLFFALARVAQVCGY